MITSLFKKSTPINYIILSLALLFLIVTYFFTHNFNHKTESLFFEKSISGVILFLSFFLTHFITKKNNITKDNDYTLLFSLLFLLFFPSIFYNFNLLLSNLLLLLAFRRIFSMHTLKDSKEKIFDASLFIIFASLFQFWCILFLLLVYLSIIFHASQDYRHWLLPLLAFVVVAVLYAFYGVLFHKNVFLDYFNSSAVSFKMDYFTSIYQNLAFSIYVVVAFYFLLSLFFLISKQHLSSQIILKKMMFCFGIGVAVFLLSNHKNNALLVFTFYPLAIIATLAVEVEKNKLLNEIILFTTFALSILTFTTQL